MPLFWNPYLPPIHDSGNNYKSSIQTDYFPFVLTHGSLRFALVKLDNHTLQLERQSYMCPHLSNTSVSTVTAKYKGSAQNTVIGQANHGWGISGLATSGDPCSTTYFDGNYQPASGTNGCPRGLSSALTDDVSAACVPNLTYLPSFRGTKHSPQGQGSSGNATMATSPYIQWGWKSMLACTTGSDDFGGPPNVDSINDVGDNVPALHCNLCTPNKYCDCSGTQQGSYNYYNNFYASPGFSWFYSSGASWSVEVAHQGKGPYNDTLYYHNLQTTEAWSENTYNTIYTSLGYHNASFYMVGHAMADLIYYDQYDGSYPFSGAFAGFKTPSHYYAFTGTGGINDEFDYGMNYPSDVTADGLSFVNLANSFSSFNSNTIFPNPADYRANFPSYVNDQWNVQREGGTNAMSYYAIVLLPTTTEQKASAASEYANLDFKLHLDIMSVAWQKVLGSNYQYNSTGGHLGNGTNYSGIQGSAYLNNSPATSSSFWALYDAIGGQYQPLAQSNTGIQHQLTQAYEDRVYSTTSNSADLHLQHDYAMQAFGGILDGEFVPLDSAWWDADADNNKTPSGFGTTSSLRNPWGIQILNEMQKHIIREVAYKGYPDELTPNYQDRDKTILVVKTPACAPHWRLLSEGCFHTIDWRQDNPYFNLHVTGPVTGGTNTVMFRDVATGFQDDGCEIRSVAMGWADYDTTYTGFPNLPSTTYPFEWQGGGDIDGAGVGYNNDIYGTCTLGGVPIKNWQDNYDPTIPGVQNLDLVEVLPTQFIGFNTTLLDANDNYNAGTHTSGAPSYGSFDPADADFNNSWTQKTGRQQGVFYEFDGRVDFGSASLTAAVTAGGYTHNSWERWENVPRAYRAMYLNAAGHANYTTNNRHAMKFVDDEATGQWSLYTPHSAVSGYSYNSNANPSTSDLLNPQINCLFNSSSDGAGLRDDTAHIRFLGVWKTKSRGTVQSDPSVFNYGTALDKRFPEVLRYCKHVNHKTGEVVWNDPNLNGEEFVWAPESGMKVIQTTSEDHDLNNWAIQTGNGMIYNSNYLQTCPYSINITQTNPICANETGSVTFTVNGSVAAVWSSLQITISEPNHPIPSGPMPATQTSSAPSQVFEYDENQNVSTTLQVNNFDPDALISENFTIGQTYTITNLPVGSVLTFSAQTSYLNGGCTILETATIANDNDYSIQLHSTSINLSSASCGDTNLEVDVKFSAWNNMTTTDPTSGNICWGLYELQGSPPQYQCIDAGVPWQNTNSVPVVGSHATGSMQTGHPDLETPGAQCNNVFFMCPNIKYLTTPTQYMVILSREPSAFGAVGNSYSTNYAAAANPLCAEVLNFTTQCNDVTIDSVTTTNPNCHEDDLELGFNNAASSFMDPNGVHPNTGLLASQLGAIHIQLQDNIVGNVVEILDASGSSIPGSPLTLTSSISSINFFTIAPGAYTINVYNDNTAYTNSNPSDTATTNINDPDAIYEVTSATVLDASCGGNDGAIINLAVSENDEACDANIQHWYITDNPTPLVWDDTNNQFDIFDLAGNSIFNNSQANSNFTSLAPGIYYLVMQSSPCGCAQVYGPYTVGAGGSFTAGITVNQSSCNSSSSTVVATVSSGTAPYTYTWTSTDGTFVPPSSSATASTSSTIVATANAADYTCVITDQSGCSSITLGPVSVTANAPIAINGVASSIGCGGGSGSITTNPSGGSAPYSWQWSGSSTATTQNITSLGVGTYTVVVTDNAGCTATQTFSITNLGSAETFVDVNQYEYNQVYNDSVTGTSCDDLLYGLYGGPTCPNSQDGTIRIMLDSSTPTGTFPYDVFIRPAGSGSYQQVTNNAGVNLSITSVDSYNTSTGFLGSTGAAFDPCNLASNTYFEIKGNDYKAGGSLLAFTAGSSWDVKLIENGGGACESVVTTTILASDYQTVIASEAITQPSSCSCSSYGASTINTCDGAIDLTPSRGSYENHVGDQAYTYLWTYAANSEYCGAGTAVNFNTQWTNQTSQDISAQWPGLYTYTVTDECGGVATDTITLEDPVNYITDLYGIAPLCADCCDGELYIAACSGSQAKTLEVSVDNGTTWTQIGSSIQNTYTLTGLCAGIYSVWIRDNSGCVTEYFADPDDSSILSTYSAHGHADAVPCLTTYNHSSPQTSQYTPAQNSLTSGTSTATAYTEPSCTKIKLEPNSTLTDLNACVTSHNQFPGDTSASITLNIVGGTPPYEITAQATAGPVYSPNTGLIPCMGIGPLSPGVDPCTLSGGSMANNLNSLNNSIWTISEDGGATFSSFSQPVATSYTTNATSLIIENVSVSLDLGPSYLGAEYTFLVKDSHDCFQQAKVGVDNGLFGIISVYGAQNCDCVCPPGYELDQVVGSPTNGECISTQIAPIVANASTLEFWGAAKDLYTQSILPVNIGSNGAILYGPYSGGVVSYGASLSVNILALPFVKDLSTAGTNLLVMDDLSGPVIGADISAFNSTSAVWYNRLSQIAIWRNDGTVNQLPVAPQNEFIGCITEINFAAPTESIVALSASEEIKMFIDGAEYIHLDATSGNATTIADNTDYVHLFPLILPAGLHSVAFEVINTASTDAYLAFEIYPNKMAFGQFAGAYFVTAVNDPGFVISDLTSNILQDANGDDLSSSSFINKEIQLGTTTVGYSCSTAGTTVQVASGTMFCQSDVTAPCEVPLDCGNCYDSDGNPAPTYTKKGPCTSATDANGVLLNNEWVSDDSALADLVECPGSLANEALAKIHGALASNVLDIRQIWLTIMIKHMLQNLNICFSLQDIQDSFTGYLDEVCPTCEVGENLTPAQMEAVVTQIFNTNNSNFDF